MTPLERRGSAPVVDELEFLLARMTRGDHTWVGASSNAIVVQALTGAPDPLTWPCDASDLSRCEKTYELAPDHLQKKMLPTLERFRAHVAERNERYR